MSSLVYYLAATDFMSKLKIRTTQVNPWRVRITCILMTTQLRGQGGGSEVDFYFFIVSHRGVCQLPGTFSEWKNIVPNLSYRILKSQKYIQLHCVHELKSRFPEN